MADDDAKIRDEDILRVVVLVPTKNDSDRKHDTIITHQDTNSNKRQMKNLFDIFILIQ